MRIKTIQALQTLDRTLVSDHLFFDEGLDVTTFDGVVDPMCREILLHLAILGHAFGLRLLVLAFNINCILVRPISKFDHRVTTAQTKRLKKCITLINYLYQTGAFSHWACNLDTTLLDGKLIPIMLVRSKFYDETEIPGITNVITSVDQELLESQIAKEIDPDALYDLIKRSRRPVQTKQVKPSEWHKHVLNLASNETPHLLQPENNDPSEPERRREEMRSPEREKERTQLVVDRFLRR